MAHKFLARVAIPLLVVGGSTAAVGPGQPPSARAQQPTAEPLAPRIFLPFLLLGPVPSPMPQTSLTPTSLASATPEPTATQLPPPATATTPPAGPGIPACDGTEGDAGGFRFSLDDGASLAPNAGRLASLAYTWDVELDPRDPNRILELHENKVYQSLDAGCRFELLATLPAGGPWDDIVRAPSLPELLVAGSVFDHRLLVSEDDGKTWTAQEGLPDDTVRLAISPTDPWDWVVAGREGFHRRQGRDAKWDSLPPPFAPGGIVSAAAIEGAWGSWWVGSQVQGLYRVDEHGREWQQTATEMYLPVGDPAENVLSVVGVWVTAAPGDPDRAYAAVNRVGRDQAERGVWRTDDGGRTWRKMLVNGQAVGMGGTVTLTGGTRVFVSPHDADRVIVPFGMAFQGYGTDLYRSTDGLETVDLRHFDGFYEVMSLRWGPAESGVLYVGVSSDIPNAR